MRTSVVKRGSRLIGKSCRLCPERVAEGHAVAQIQLGATFGQTDAVFHVECLAAKLDEAPVGVPVRNIRARFHALRRRLAAAV